MYVREKNYKTFRENIEVKHYNLIIRLGKDILDMTSKAQRQKKNIDKLCFIRTKIICVSKDTIKRVERQQKETKYLKITYLIRNL